MVLFYTLIHTQVAHFRVTDLKSKWIMFINIFSFLILNFFILFLSLVWLLTHLAVEQGVVVPPHLRVNVVQVPLEAFTLQTLPQGRPLGDVPIIDTVVLQEQGLRRI